MPSDSGDEARSPRPRREINIELSQSVVDDLVRLGLGRRETRNDSEPERGNDSPQADSESQQDDSGRRESSSSKDYELASLIEGFLDSSFLEEEDDDGRVKIAKKDCYFPDPLITFLIDQPDLTCVVCMEELEIGELASESRDSNIAILPCGHVGCQRCLKTWLAQHRRCPVCREKMRHRNCGHTVTPAVITFDTIASLPRTFPKGGYMSRNCRKCEVKGRMEKAVKMLRLAARGITNARRNIRTLDLEDDHITLMCEVVESQYYRVPKEYAEALKERSLKW
ncbi:hypothetical protein F5Y13DRAFT_200247 [Hypoxylon sp. FL1857]|nr:hypothetical protein F5Y13DRAFT_200247 [Hypoxylon sp. FL1857]